MHSAQEQQEQPHATALWQRNWLALALSAASWLVLAHRQWQAEQQLKDVGLEEEREQADPVVWRERERRLELQQVQRRRRQEPGLAAELALNRMLSQATHMQRIEVSCKGVRGIHSEIHHQSSACNLQEAAGSCSAAVWPAC